jgi:hypothetical protein
MFRLQFSKCGKLMRQKRNEPRCAQATAGLWLRVAKRSARITGSKLRDNTRLAFAGALARKNHIVGGGILTRHFRPFCHPDPASRGRSNCPGGVISIVVNPMGCRKRYLLLPNGSCEPRRKQCDDPPLLNLCQILFRFDVRRHQEISG